MTLNKFFRLYAAEPGDTGSVDRGDNLPADIEANIASEHYFTAAQGVQGETHQRGDFHCGSLETGKALSLLTFCVLVLRNGFTVTGESACASPENFDAELGRKIARKNAIDKVWPLMGYALKERLAAG